MVWFLGGVDRKGTRPWLAARPHCVGSLPPSSRHHTSVDLSTTADLLTLCHLTTMSIPIAGDADERPQKCTGVFFSWTGRDAPDLLAALLSRVDDADRGEAEAEAAAGELPLPRLLDALDHDGGERRHRIAAGAHVDQRAQPGTAGRGGGEADEPERRLGGRGEGGAAAAGAAAGVKGGVWRRWRRWDARAGVGLASWLLALRGLSSRCSAEHEERARVRVSKLRSAGAATAGPAAKRQAGSVVSSPPRPVSQA